MIRSVLSLVVSGLKQSDMVTAFGGLLTARRCLALPRARAASDPERLYAAGARDRRCHRGNSCVCQSSRLLSKLRVRAQRDPMRREPPKSVCRRRPLRPAKRKLAANSSWETRRTPIRKSIAEGVDQRPVAFRHLPRKLGFARRSRICCAIPIIRAGNARVDYMRDAFRRQANLPSRMAAAAVVR